jgi:general secretion pathway protein M
MNALLTWYRARDEREQRMLLIGGCAIVLIVLLGVWLALHSRVVAASERLDTKRHDLSWLQAQMPALAARPAGKVGPEESLVILIDRVAHESGIATALAGSQQAGNDGYRVRLEKAQFDGLVSFISQLTQRHGVVVDTANVDATENSGIVNATLVLHKT